MFPEPILPVINEADFFSKAGYKRFKMDLF